MKLYIPAFFSTSYETKINKKLRQPETLALANKDYNELWKLKIHAEKVAASLHELKSIVHNKSSMNDLNKYTTEAFDLVIRGGKLNPTLLNQVQNSLFHLHNELLDYACWEVTLSCLNVISNSFLLGFGGTSTLLLTAAALTGPASAVLFSMGMAILAATITVLAAYSLYVDARFIVDQQIADIEEGVKFLSNFKSNHLYEPVSQNYSTYSYE
ncbi:MAG: hypothetical protein LEGION0403_FIIPPAGN_00083 [Legionella sp.]|uniref:hypothetical protein n=1 Tax=Legionella sp. TaxID=459 RepID=UPI003D119D09